MDKRKKVVGEWRQGMDDMMRGNDSHRSFSVNIVSITDVYVFICKIILSSYYPSILFLYYLLLLHPFLSFPFLYVLILILVCWLFPFPLGRSIVSLVRGISETQQ